MSQYNPDLSADGLNSALAELSKAAEATSLSKGSGVAQDTPEHEDERGGGQGQLASKSDFAGFDNLMIGKMAATLADAGFAPDDIAAFMKNDEDKFKGKGKGGKGGFPWAKMEDEEDDDEGGEDEEEAKKSMDAFAYDDDIREGMDASPFLKSMVARTAERLDRNEIGIARRLRASEERNNETLATMAKAMTAMTTMVKGLASHSASVAERLGIVESTPLPGRGASSVAEAQAMAKSRGGASIAGEQLSKSHIGGVISYMRCEKDITEADGVYLSDAIAQIDSNLVRPEVVALAKSFLAANPTEAVRAINYR